MKQLPINNLNQRVTINQPVITSDGTGGQSVSWMELATVYAEVVPVGNYTVERNLADSVNAQAGYRVTIRARTDVTADMRVVWKSHTLLIVSMHEADRMLEILTHEVAL